METPKIELVKLDLVDRPQDPLRTRIDPEKIRELAESIREVGLQEPVLLRPLNGRFEVVAGDRRYLAHKFLAWEHILAIVTERTDEETVIIRATENLQREDLTPMEEARSYQSMRNKLGYGIDKIARKMGRAHTTIKKYLDLLELDPEFQEAIDAKKLGIEVAYVLCKIDDPEMRKYYVGMAIENGITRDVAVNWLTSYQRSKEAKYYDGGGSGAGVSAAGEERATYQTCQVCNGPCEIKTVRYIPVCAECLKEIKRG